MLLKWSLQPFTCSMHVEKYCMNIFTSGARHNLKISCGEHRWPAHICPFFNHFGATSKYRVFWIKKKTLCFSKIDSVLYDLVRHLYGLWLYLLTSNLVYVYSAQKCFGTTLVNYGATPLDELLARYHYRTSLAEVYVLFFDIMNWKSECIGLYFICYKLLSYLNLSVMLHSLVLDKRSGYCSLL